MPESSDCILVRRGKCGHRHMKGRWPRFNEHQGWLATPGSRKKLGRFLLSRFQREPGPAFTLTVDVHLDCERLACRTERIHLCPRGCLLCGTLCGWAAAAPSGPRVSWESSPSGVLVCSDLCSVKVSRCWAVRGCEHSRKR